MTSREWESVLNIRLSDELRRYGLNAKPEVIYPGNRRIDVEVRIGPVVIAVEAEHGQITAKRSQAIREADARLEQGLAQCAVAVCYQEETTGETLPNAQVIWTVRDGNSLSNTSNTAAEWTTGDIERLVSVIRLTPAQLGDPDAAAAALSGSLDGAVRRLSEEQKQELARALDLPRQTRNGRPVAHPWDGPAKRALLVVATAVMFHSRLDVHLRGLRPEVDSRANPPEPFIGDWPPTPAQVCLNNDATIQAYLDAWNLILALDYKPIFETGRAALLACPPDPSFAAAVRDTARAALAVAENIASLRHDLLGRIFHTVLDTARYDGSFYTTTPAATLLAALAITEDTCDWQNPEAIAKLRITDPACGTGTLLMAAAERIRDLAPQSRDNEELAAALIEQTLAGYDVNLTATHMAATTLGLLSPTTRFRNMKIGRAFLGVDDGGKAYLGSLEFLDQQPKLMPWPNAAQAITQVDSGEEMAQAEPADLVIMNPPFTRDSLRHDQFSRGDERKIKEREMELFANKPVHLSSNGNAFVVLADYINKAETGVIASVLPLVTATNASAQEIRQHLAGRYHVETIVTSHDPDRIYFSENTTIGEMLLICRRWPSRKGQKPPTQVVNLVINPSTPAEAFNVANAIVEGKIESLGYGTVQQWPERRISAGNWGAVQFLSPGLCERFISLRGNETFLSAPLGEISKIGPAGRRTMDAFTKSSLPDGIGRIGLWNHNTKVTQSMSSDGDTFIKVKASKEHLAEKYWNERGKLLLPQRLFLQTTRVVSTMLEHPGLGGAWTPCKPIDTFQGESVEKSICVYLNSSIGVLAILGDRSNKKPTYPNLSLDDLRKIPVPNFAALGEGLVEQLAAAYDQYAESVMLPLPQMEQCPVRRGVGRGGRRGLGVGRGDGSRGAAAVGDGAVDYRGTIRGAGGLGLERAGKGLAHPLPDLPLSRGQGLAHPHPAHSRRNRV